MSYDIDTVRVLALADARMRVSDVRRLSKLLRGCPESNFIDAMNRALSDQAFADAEVLLPSLQWRGEGSGSTYMEVFKEQVVPAIRGRVDAVLFWARGDSVSGLRIVDGVMTEPPVIMVLGQEEKS